MTTKKSNGTETETKFAAALRRHVAQRDGLKIIEQPIFGAPETQMLVLTEQQSIAGILGVIKAIDAGTLKGFAESELKMQFRDVLPKLLTALMSEYLASVDDEKHIELWDTERSIASDEISEFLSFVDAALLAESEQVVREPS